MEVWFAFVAKSLSDPSLGVHYSEIDDNLRHIFIAIMNELTTTDLFIPDLDISL